MMNANSHFATLRYPLVRYTITTNRTDLKKCIIYALFRFYYIFVFTGWTMAGANF